jgi:hypothetical protein
MSMIFLKRFFPFLYPLIFLIAFPDLFLMAQFICGYFVGFYFFLVDRFLHAFFLYPETEFNQLVQKALKDKKYLQMVKVLLQADTLQEKLLTRSILFFCIYIALTFFVMTSTGSIIGIGLMLGLGMHICLDLLSHSKDTETFHKHFLWQLKRKLSQKEVERFVAGFIAFFGVASILVLL